MFEIEHHLIEYKGGTIIVRFELIDRKHVKINIHTSTSNIAYVVLINEVFQYIKFNVWGSYMEWLNKLNNQDLIDVE